MIVAGKERVVIVGGGIIGAMCAWYLNRSGHDVTILDKGKFGAACSHGNCGYVSPSHVLPLPQPGAVRDAIPALFKRNSPLSIRWRWSPSLWRWLWNFSRRCNERDMLEAATGRSALLQLSHGLYDRLIKEENVDCEWKELGLLFVFRTPKHFEHYAKTNELISREFGVEAVPLNGDALINVEPALKPGLGGAWHYRGDCHLRPDRLMSALREKLENCGTRIVEDSAVSEFVDEGSSCRAIRAADQFIEGDQFIVATGAWTPFLNQHLGCDVPIQPGKGYSITMPHPHRCPKIPMILEEHRVAVTPLTTKYRIGSTMEFAGYDPTINQNRIDLLKKASEIYLHDAHCEPVEEQWYGWRPMTWDGKPVIDRSPRLKNVWIAAGHNMLGLSMGTGTGKLVQQLIDQEEPEIDLQHFRLSRFSR